jgi:hypothetical protein
MSFFLALALVGGDAEAGKLADGFRGQGWGRYEDGKLKTSGSCVASPEKDSAFVCQQQFGDASIEVAYMAEFQIFYGIFAVGTSFDNCSGFFDVLKAAYGEGSPKIKSMNKWGDERYWFDGNVGASWSYNQFSKQCNFTISHFDFYDEAKKPSMDRAKEAAQGL